MFQMRATAPCTLFLPVILYLSSCINANELSRGWGDDINWVNFKEGLELAKIGQKPMFLLIHKSWCSACKSLAPQFAVSTEIAEAGKKFIMVNVQDDEEPEGQIYNPDGSYIPRILFLDCNGDVKSDAIYNKRGSERYKFYYSDPTHIVESMKEALNVLECNQPGTVTADEL